MTVSDALRPNHDSHLSRRSPRRFRCTTAWRRTTLLNSRTPRHIYQGTAIIGRSKNRKEILQHLFPALDNGSYPQENVRITIILPPPYARLAQTMSSNDRGMLPVGTYEMPYQESRFFLPYMSIPRPSGSAQIPVTGPRRKGVRSVSVVVARRTTDRFAFGLDRLECSFSSNPRGSVESKNKAFLPGRFALASRWVVGKTYKPGNVPFDSAKPLRPPHRKDSGQNEHMHDLQNVVQTISIPHPSR